MRIELIHPMIVHFPIVLGLALFAYDAFASVRRKPLSGGGTIANTSAFLAFMTGVFAVLVLIFGDQAYDVAMATAKAPKDALEIHQEIGTLAAFAFAGWATVRSFLWWRNVNFGSAMKYGIVAVEAVLALVVLVAAWYGGELVYNYGVAVGV